MNSTPKAFINPIMLASNELSWNTTEAVSEEYIKKAEEIACKLPSETWEVVSSAKPTEEREKTIEFYINPWWAKMNPDTPIASCNPFNLYLPSGLKDFDSWTREQGHYNNFSRQNTYNSNEMISNFIKVVKAWNIFHIGFLKCLNISDSETRYDSFISLGQKNL